MQIKQLYTGCLAEAAYYIESEGEAAVIDPLRDIQPYTELAKRDQAKIKYIFETHFHADFVSGHLDLADKTGATIVYGPTAKAYFNFHEARDGEIFHIGKITIKVLHTPGHTLESSTYLLIDEDGHDHAIFSGDTLFIGDVGRPDLAVTSDMTKENLAGMLYDSLHEKILPLPDEVIIYPGHGAGSQCGKNMSDETTDTLGNQRKLNYALQAKSKTEFIESVLNGIVPPPQYFPKNAQINRKGYEPIESVYIKGLRKYNPDEFETRMKEKDVLVLDTRQPAEFAKAHIPGSLNIALDGSFAVWAGTLINELDMPILFVTTTGREKETITRLARVGYDNVLGFLKGSISAWIRSSHDIATVNSISSGEFEYRLNQQLNILDVRTVNEFNESHIIGAINFPLNYIHDHLNELDKNLTYYIHCKAGYRSMIAASILLRNGFKHIIEVAEGFDSIRKTNVKITQTAAA